MKNPTSNGNDLYQVGNDYPQVAEKYFVPGSYKDGIYTEVNSALCQIDGTIEGTDLPVSSDPFFDLKNKNGLNKRVLNVLPQKKWTDPDATPASAFSGAKYLSDDYATASAEANFGTEVEA